MTMMIRVCASLIALLLLCYCPAAGSMALSSLSSSARHQQTAQHRRAFLEISTRRVIIATAPFLVATATTTTAAANAYERRNVGGEGRSPETAAMNEQAYQTSNRLEQQGFKVESLEEQKATLSAALSDYSYDNNRSSSSSSSSSSKKSNEKQQRASKK